MRDLALFRDFALCRLEPLSPKGRAVLRVLEARFPELYPWGDGAVLAPIDLEPVLAAAKEEGAII